VLTNPKHKAAVKEMTAFGTNLTVRVYQAMKQFQLLALYRCLAVVLNGIA